MQDILTLPKNNFAVRNYVFDAIGIAFLYSIPTISHMFSFPVYLFEPMRIILILSLVHSTKKNAYLLALTLPLFSFITASHPVFVKTLLITCEMTINVWLFFYLSKKTSNLFYIAYTSIVLSKSFYYIGKFLLIKSGLLNTNLVDTPILIQLSLILILSVYAFVIMNGRSDPIKV
jgi:hypothetical protein